MERKTHDPKPDLASRRTQHRPHGFPCEDHLPSFEKDDPKRVIEALGPMPREVLTAMIDYGLSDSEISQYYRLSTDTIASLRLFYGIAEDSQTG